MKNRSGLALVLCVLVLGLAGCATKSVDKSFAFDGQGNEGLVVLSISHDLAGGRGVKAIFYLNGGVAARDGKMFLSLNDAVPGIPGGSAFQDSYGQLLVMALPEGRHQIDSWQITNGTGLSISAKEKPAPLVFDVRKGQVKYLGNLHAVLLRGKNLFGITITGNGYPEVRDERKRDIPIFEQKYPQFAGKLAIDLLPQGPWGPAVTRTQVNIPPPVVPR